MVKAKSATTKAIEDTEFWAEYILRMLVEGTTPFLMNNPRGMKTTPTGIRTKKIPTPEEAAETATYRRDDGTLGFPADAVRKYLIGGGTSLKVGTRAASTVLPEVIGHFPPLEGDELFPFETPEGQPIRDYEIDTRRVVRGGQGVPASRPKIWPWRLRCTLKLTVPYDTEMESFRRDLLRIANKSGQYPGLGDGRPEKIKGMGMWFGKSKVLELEIEPLEE